MLVSSWLSLGTFFLLCLGLQNDRYLEAKPQQTREQSEESTSFTRDTLDMVLH
jgi:hypothetical protein